MFLNILEKVRRKGKGTKLIGNGCTLLWCSGSKASAANKGFSGGR